MKTKFILSLLTSFFLAALFGGALSIGLELNPVACVGGTFLTSLVPTIPAGALGMAVQREIWVDYIIENLFMNNEWIKHAFNHDNYVLSGKVVHEPKAGAKPTVVKNRSSFPATAVKRTDTDGTYALDEYTTDPFFIPNADTVELSYDKIASVLGETMETIQEAVGTYMLQNWIPSTKVLTTGVASAAHLGTGVRKALTLDDIIAIKVAMNNANIPQIDRHLLLDSTMVEQLASSLRVNENRDFSVLYDQKEGIIKRIEGFDVHVRSEVYRADGSTIKLPDWEITDTAVAGGLAWQKNAVARAVGDVGFFDDQGNPLYYGDIYSALVRAGGRVRRPEGCIAILQDTPA